MDNKKNAEKTQKNKALVSEELLKRLASRKKQRVFFIRINPLIPLVFIIVVAFLFIGLLRGDSYTNKITLDELIRGIAGNRFAEVIVQNDGRILAQGKSYVVYTGELPSISEPNKKGEILEFDIMTIDDLIALITKQDVVSQIRALFNKEDNSIENIVLGKDYIIATKFGNTPRDILINGVGEEEFFNRLEELNVNLSDISVPIEKIRTKGFETNRDSFLERINSGQFSEVYILSGLFVGKINSDLISKSYIDWTPNINTFITSLQQEGISLSRDNYELIPQNMASGLTLNDIFSILTLAGFVILGIIIFRGAQSSGMGISQFGQSKAKLFFGSKTDTTFKDVAGIDEAREELNEIVDFLKTPNKFRKLGARIPKGILMVGPPGTGKTLLARAIAGEAGVPFFHTSGSEFEEMLVGAGASRVRDLFVKAKKTAPSLVFIDEIDAVARKRGTKIQSGTTEQTLNQILVEMDGFEKNTNVIVLAATNRPDVLDPAILRPGRFDRQIRIELPDMEGRTQILQVHGKNKPFAADVNLEKIAKRTIGFTGADLENILNEAAIIAAKDGAKEVSMAHIEEAVSKILLGPAKRSRKRTEKELKLVAYHEAGHAVVAKYIPDATPVDKISIVSRGMSGGVTMFLPEKDEYITSKRKLIADITVSLGGRAAEEEALDDVSTGASNDIEKATAVARKMIQRFGMSQKLGLVQYGDFEENEYLGYAYNTSKEYSDKTAEEIDKEVRELIETAYANAKEILKTHRDKLDRVAEELLAKEVLSKEEFEQLF